MNDVTDCVRSTINLRRARFYKVFGTLKDALEAMEITISGKKQVVALHLPRFQAGSSTNQTRREEAQA
jgi:hypothetical protein